MWPRFTPVCTYRSNFVRTLPDVLYSHGNTPTTLVGKTILTKWIIRIVTYILTTPVRAPFLLFNIKNIKEWKIFLSIKNYKICEMYICKFLRGLYRQKALYSFFNLYLYTTPPQRFQWPFEHLTLFGFLFPILFKKPYKTNLFTMNINQDVNLSISVRGKKVKTKPIIIRSQL